MTEIIHKTTNAYFGPWLLDRASLDALDEIIVEQWGVLQAHRKRLIDNAVRRERDRRGKPDSNAELSEGQSDQQNKEIRQRAEEEYAYPDDGRTITLTLSSGNKVRVSNFRDAANDVNCQGHEVVKIEVKLYCAGIRGDVVVPTADKSKSLSLVTLPEASEQAVELFVRLNRWAEEHKPDWFHRIRGIGAVPAWALAALIVFFFSVIAYLTGGMRINSPWMEEVRNFVAKGVKPDDYGRALELLLQHVAGVSDQSQVIGMPIWWYVAAVTTAIVASLLSIQARTAFEIGKGVKSIRRQKWYNGFLRKSIVGFLIMGVLASALGSMVFDLLRSK